MIVLETFFEGRKRAEVAQLLGISVKPYDNHLPPAFSSLRHLWTQDAEVFTDLDRSLWYDLIEELHERDAAARQRRASAKTGERSTSEGERSNFVGDRSNSEHDRGKNSRALAKSAVSPAKS